MAGSCRIGSPKSSPSSVLTVRKPGSESKPEDIRKAAGSQLIHYIGAVNLHCARTDAEIIRNGLVWMACREPGEYLALAIRKRVNSNSRRIRRSGSVLAIVETCAALLQCRQEIVAAKRLFEKVDRAFLHRAYGKRGVAVPGHYDDREDRAMRLQLAMYSHAVATGHANV